MSNHSLACQEPFSLAISRHTLFRRIREICGPLAYRPGVHTRNNLLAAGFIYTGNGDAAQCNTCGLEVSGWTKDMIPFSIHSERSPDCLFVHDIKTSIPLSTTAIPPNTSVPNQRQNTIERRSIESFDAERSSNCFPESDLLQRVRKRTFSHWPYGSALPGAQMVKAGFFQCNVGNVQIQDRVICIYCDLICQQWTPYVDDPCDVHKTCSPNCKFVKASLTHHGPIPILNDGGSSIKPIRIGPSNGANYTNPLQIGRSGRREARNNVPPNNRPAPIDDSIQRSHFSTDNKDMVVCHTCRRAFRELDSNENPMIDHARQFPPCPYARRFYPPNYPGQGMIQHDNGSNTTLFMDNGRLVELDENTLSRFVNARLQLPISQNLSNQNYRLSIIQKCWEDQLRLRGHDFITALDLAIACLIYRKQIDHIVRKDKAIIPSASMRQWRKRQAEEAAEMQPKRRATVADDKCIICFEAEKVLAILPCGHLTTCVPCGHAVKSCPLCRGQKEAVVTIYT